MRVDQPAHGKVTVTPAVPADGVVKAGTVLNVKVEVTDAGYREQRHHEPRCFYHGGRAPRWSPRDPGRRLCTVRRLRVSSYLYA